MAVAPVVLDNGTGTVRCGCAGVSPLPLLLCPTVIGRPTMQATALCSVMADPQASSSSSVSLSKSSSYAPVLQGLTSVSGREDTPRRLAQLLRRAALCGEDLAAADMPGVVERTYPMRNGVIHNMNAMQAIWDYTLCERLPPLVGPSWRGTAAWRYEDGLAWLQDKRLLLSEPPNMSLRQRCELLELFFESYHLSAIQTVQQGILSLFASGTERGVVVECGEGLSHCTPVFEGFVLATAQRLVGVAGRAVTERLGQALAQQQPYRRYQDPLPTGAGRAAWSYAPQLSTPIDVLRQIKERYCYVASRKDGLEYRLTRETSALHCECVLPDGTSFRLGPERFVAAEVLFSPQEMDCECDGVATALWKSMEAADIDVRASLYANIILSGGTTLLPGFGDRLEREIKDLYWKEKRKGNQAPMERCPIRVKEPQRRQHMAYMGGALFAELSQDQPERWLSRSIYEEGGASAIIARSCGAG
ncbi:hypothetical protein GH5_07457 [Leishmania sp. Ghana 2012 LV757]|uniref:hypothetical protein n=1 Tax=Leishmania sp. Ghana 2012 LV757 TaxID=2803181 RepID=UPI001B76F171|nr:hypothetical protein GH5_07457 [Leishmania sp. Ghana 2012 LV757]